MKKVQSPDIVRNPAGLSLASQVREARQSEKSTLPRKFILTDVAQIGTHEHTDGSKLSAVLNAILVEGYRGPAISVFQTGSDDVYNALEPSDEPTVQESSRYGQFGIADGHNRLAALKILNKLNLLKSPLVPFQIVPCRSPDIVRVETLNSEEEPASIEEIEACFREKNKVIPPSTTHFQVKLRNDTWVRLREGQPDIHIPLEDLIKLDEYEKVKVQPGTLEESIAAVLQNEEAGIEPNQG